jgi:FlaA1/EpsC-like NDP-sugar epimerase
MKQMLFKRFFVPRWIILLTDSVILTLSFAFSYFIIKQFEFTEILRGHFFIYTGIFSFISIAIFYSMRIYTGLIRYSNVHDMFRIFSAVILTSLIYPLVNQLIVLNIFHIHSLEIGKVLITNFFVSSSLLIMYRTGVKGMYYYIKRIIPYTRESVLIYGSDKNSVIIKHALLSSNEDDFDIVGFIDLDQSKVNSYIEQIKIYHLNELSKLKNKKNIDKLIITNEQLANKETQAVIDCCLNLSIRVLTVPPSDQWVNGKLSSRQIQNLKIDDLLQREPIVINNHRIRGELSGKRILVTGASGSIGSEIVRQVMRYEPAAIILCDQAESPLHEIQLEIEGSNSETEINVFIGSIRDTNRLEELFRAYKPQVVFHAAAYKHVPMMEKHPVEAILTNVHGTKNVADLSVLYGVEKFVMISTDKAVNPTNIMGASKRIAEMYVQSLNNALEEQFEEKLQNIMDSTNLLSFDSAHARTKFITTRFGNVLNSNGSVVPRFRTQIESGGPLTVTHPEITRYFMTIPEAVQLVLEAGIMGKGGEIFVFDMGEPVKINDLARKMIRLAGLVPDREIKIVYTGLRPGEKLYEELLNQEEKTIPTHHEKIKIAKVISNNYEKVTNDIQELISMTSDDDHTMMVRKMKEMIPEYISENSKYEQLDEKIIDGKQVKSIRQAKVILLDKNEESSVLDI